MLELLVFPMMRKHGQTLNTTEKNNDNTRYQQISNIPTACHSGLYCRFCLTLNHNIKNRRYVYYISAVFIILLL